MENKNDQEIQDNQNTKQGNCYRCGEKLGKNEDLFCWDCILATSDEDLWK